MASARWRFLLALFLLVSFLIEPATSENVSLLGDSYAEEKSTATAPNSAALVENHNTANSTKPKKWWRKNKTKHVEPATDSNNNASFLVDPAAEDESTAAPPNADAVVENHISSSNNNSTKPKKWWQKKNKAKNKPKKKTWRKKKKATKSLRSPVVLPPPTIHKHAPLSRTKRWLRGLGHRIGLSKTKLDAFYDPRQSFEMGFLSVLSYWDFHKNPTSNHKTMGFALAEQDDDYRLQDHSWSSLIRDSHPITGSLQNQREPPPTPRKRRQPPSRPFYTLEYSFYDWHEPTVTGVSFHDTDVLVSTAVGRKNLTDTLVISFAGTASVKDAVTNVQTFEPANHSMIFEPPEPRKPWNSLRKLTTNNTTKIQGSIHRGFLNAYSRVQRGFVLRLGSRRQDKDDDSGRKHGGNSKPSKNILDALDRRFGHCYATPKLSPDEEEEASHGSNATPKTQTKKNATKAATTTLHGCSVTNKKGRGGEPQVRLSLVLRELVEEALSNGYKVHVTGHSLGGALATMLVLDVLTSEGKTSSVDDLYLWTFGAPQVADSLFWESLARHSKRFRHFFSRRRKQRVRRYVTMSDGGKVDVVTEVTKTALAAHKGTAAATTSSTSGSTKKDKPIVGRKKPAEMDDANQKTKKPKKPKKEKKHNTRKPKRKWAGPGVWHGKVANSLGGVSRGGEVAHFVDAHYLWTPEQHRRQLEHQHQQPQMGGGTPECVADASTETSSGDNCGDGKASATPPTTATHSSVAAHKMSNYLMGISRESEYHPLVPDAPSEWLEYAGINPASSSTT